MKIYKENIEKYNDRIRRLSKILNRMSLLRLFVFIILTVVLIFLFSTNLITPVFIVLPVSFIAFAIVIKHHNKIAYLKKHNTFLKTINESEIQRENCNLEEFDSGLKFINQNHPYTSDLDIFGQHSVFQLINRTTTESGEILLSKWLSEPAPDSEIKERQKAIKELSQKLNWMQDFQASGMHFQNKQSEYNKLLDWVAAPVVLFKNRYIYIALAIILPLLFLISVSLFYVHLGSPTGLVYFSAIILVLLTSYFVLRKIRPQAENIVETSTENLKTLKAYRSLIQKIENESFKAEKLKVLQSLLLRDQYSAYREIGRICKILDFSHQKPIKKIAIGGNYLYSVINSFLLLDIYLILGTEKWKLKNKSFLKQWAEAVSEFEVINSFAGFCHSNPSFVFPELTEKNNYIHFGSLGHPLINSKTRVCNDFHSGNYGELVMITGSNMAGKSTFLRSIGVNLVLALAGAPCCAEKARVSNLRLYTSMRTQDNLRKGISSFFAELSRIEKMLKLIDNKRNIYFLLDEMFKGTNSKDRHKGGFSLISQLNKLKTSGIIATHDIELAKLAGDKNLVKNFSFNSEIRDNSMIFNYKLEQEICHDFNASELMKKSGIKVLSNIHDKQNS